MVWYWEDGTDSSWLLYCHTSFFVVIELGEMLLGVKSLFLSYGMYLVCPLSGVFVSGLISMNHCWIGRVNVANSPSADVVCPQDPHPSRAHPTEWEVKKGLYIYPKWSMYLPMIFLDNSSTISISYTVYKYMQYILYIQYIYTQYIYVYRIMYTYFFTSPCYVSLLRAVSKPTKAHRSTWGWWPVVFPCRSVIYYLCFKKNRLFGCLWHLKYICIQYVYIYIYIFIVKFFLILCT